MFRGPDALETSVNEVLRDWRKDPDGSPPIDLDRHQALFSDLVVFLHERVPEDFVVGEPAHARLMRRVAERMLNSQERKSCEGDMARSVEAALAVIRDLCPVPPSRPRPDQDSGSKKRKPQRDQSDDSPLRLPNLRHLASLLNSVRRAALVRQMVRDLGLDQVMGGPTRPGVPSDLVLVQEIAQLLRNRPDLMRILELMGRWRQEEARRDSAGVQPPLGEYYDLEPGGELDRVVPGELVLLAHPQTELEFYRRLTERSLCQYERRPQPRERGPMVICIDRSESMRGHKGVLARAAALVALQHAQKRRRDAWVVFFNEEAIDFALPARGPWKHNLLDVLAEPCFSGTNYRAGLGKCRDLIGGDPASRADILLIGDAQDSPDVDAKWYKQFGAWLRRSETRLWTVYVQDPDCPLLETLKGLSAELVVVENAQIPIPSPVGVLLTHVFNPLLHERGGEFGFGGE
jgi:hypothetical protein